MDEKEGVKIIVEDYDNKIVASVHMQEGEHDIDEFHNMCTALAIGLGFSVDHVIEKFGV